MKKPIKIIRVHFNFMLKPSFFSIGFFTSGILYSIVLKSKAIYSPSALGKIIEPPAFFIFSIAIFEAELAFIINPLTASPEDKILYPERLISYWSFDCFAFPFLIKESKFCEIWERLISFSFILGFLASLI